MLFDIIHTSKYKINNMNNTMNIDNKRQKLLHKLSIDTLVESMQPSTIACKNVKTDLLRRINEGSMNSMVAILASYNALKSVSSIDESAMKVCDKIESFLNENSFESKLVYCYESSIVNTSKDFEKVLVEKMNVLAGKQVDEAKTMIRSGFLGMLPNAYKSLQLVVEDSKIALGDGKQEALDFVAYNPMTVHVVEGESVFVRFGNRVFNVSENAVVETRMPNQRFNYLSSVLENVKYDKNTKSFIHNDPILGQIQAFKNKIVRTVDGKETIMDNASEFSNKMQLLVESVVPEKSKPYSNIIDGIVLLQENLSNVIEANNVLVVDKLRTNESFALFNLESGKQYVAVLRSLYSPNVLESFNNPVEAIEFLKKRSGYDASEFLSESLAKYKAISSTKSAEITEQIGIVNAINEKIANIKDAINIAESANNTNKVNALKEVLEEANALLIEQKRILSEMSND